LRRHLSGENIPFDVLGATPFTDPDHYDLSLGGHRCDVKSFLITRREQISQIRQNPSLVLEAPALVPADQLAAEGHASQDLYLFAFLLALTAPAEEDVARALAASQPVCLIHPMPDAWVRPPAWAPLEGLALKSECAAPLTVEIGGQAAEREFVTLKLELPPRRRVAVEQTFFSLAYVHAGRRPEVRVGLHSPVRGEPYLIPSHAWGNIWVYGLSILLTGYLTYEEFRRKARLLPPDSKTFQYARTRVKNQSVPMTELHPLKDLFERLRARTA
jgi:hypothetical protein